MRTDEEQTLQMALEYVKKGLPVLPIEKPTKGNKLSGKRPCIPSDGGGTGGVYAASIELAQVQSWFGNKGKYRGYNIGIQCGIGHICLDVDPRHGGFEALAAMIQDHGELPDTWVEESGEDEKGDRGVHYWFTIPLKYKGQPIKKGPLVGYKGLDLLANGSFAVVAPSAHHTGVNYEALTPVDDVCNAPDWLIGLAGLKKDEEVVFSTNTQFPTGIKPGPEVRKFLSKGGAPSGRQREECVKAATALWGIWMSPADTSELIWNALQKCDWDSAQGDWTYNQVAALVDNVYQSDKQEPDKKPPVPLPSDQGRAIRLRAFLRGNFKYSASMDQWYRWDETAWRPDTTGEIIRFVQEMTFVELAKAMLNADSDTSAALRKEALVLQNWNKKQSALKEAGALDEMFVDLASMDQHPYLLNCKNCTVDLRTGVSRAQRKEDLITQVAGYAYVPGARSTLWDKVMHDACGGNQEVMDYLQMSFGYAACGTTQEDVFYYLYGPGGTGKTTVLEGVSGALGTYATSADPESFMLSDASPGGTRSDLVVLRGKRLVVSTEIAQGSRFSASTLNRLTGRDTISARVPYAKAPVVFKPEWTLFFGANHFPSVPGAGKRDGFWRRVKTVPFVHKLERKDMNVALGHLLDQREHGEAVLAWIIEGAKMWWDKFGKHDKNMAVPDVVYNSVAAIQDEANPITEYVQECLLLEDGATTLKSTLFPHYQKWCRAQGIAHPLGKKKFNEQVRDLPRVTEAETTFEGKTQMMCWFGIWIKD